MQRNPNLDGEMLEAIVTAIGAINAPITWRSVITATAQVTGAVYTRQALSNHPAVTSAYAKRKRHLSAETRTRPRSKAMRETKKATDLNAAEIKSLRMAVWKYEEVLIRIISNAQALNISEEQLLRPLPACDQSLGGKKQ